MNELPINRPGGCRAIMAKDVPSHVLLCIVSGCICWAPQFEIGLVFGIGCCNEISLCIQHLVSGSGLLTPWFTIQDT